AADREHQHRILAPQPAFGEPRGEHRVPPLVVGARGQFRHVVGRRVRFEAGELAEIVDRVRLMGSAAADAEDEQTAACRPYGRELRSEPLDRLAVERCGDTRCVVEISAREARHSFASPYSMSNSRRSVRTTSTAFFNRNALLSPRVRSLNCIGTSTYVCVNRSALTSTSAWNP